jgi:hypothetical protein
MRERERDTCDRSLEIAQFLVSLSPNHLERREMSLSLFFALFQQKSFALQSGPQLLINERERDKEREREVIKRERETVVLKIRYGEKTKREREIKR